ncbi:MAG TPA: LamG-like jellyroll fold domain-containing protein [Terracidiphilus sp.]|jgi:hypothetical protein|nr:LamG-like jellyroll fold domain-containing protein [Terracidiphilus sp.]
MTSCRQRVFFACSIAIALSFSSVFAQTSAAPGSASAQEKIWRFDRTDMIGGHKTEILGHPAVIDTAYGKAVQFSGNDDAVIVPEHPLAGAKAFTWEVIFRPDADGAEAQRFFHIAEKDPATGEDTQNRLLFEIRIVEGQWCLDSYAGNRGQQITLLNCKALHPLDKWYRVTAVWDGKVLKNYVGDELQGQGPLVMEPEGPGRASIGMRLNKVFPFKGAVLMARMVPRALPPGEFLKMPAKIDSAGK